MPNNLFSALKSEISRISRREIKSRIKSIHALNGVLKKTMADLKKRIVALEGDNKRLLSNIKPAAQAPALNPEEAGKIRITAKNIKALRHKLGLSQDDFARLLDISSNNVFLMEHKAGRLKVRKKTLASIVAARAMGKREAKRRLEEMVKSLP